MLLVLGVRARDRTILPAFFSIEAIASAVETSLRPIPADGDSPPLSYRRVRGGLPVNSLLPLPRLRDAPSLRLMGV
jgi:hypothetical protein